MNGFMRFCLIAFVLATVAATGVLATLWFSWEPMLPIAVWLAGMDWFDIALIATLSIAAAGLAIILIYAIAAPGKASKLSIVRDGGTVSITKDAIRSTAEHALGARGSLTTKDLKVGIHGRRDPRISVDAKIEPGANGNLAALGESLQHEVSTSISTLTGRPVKSVDISFVGEPKSASGFKGSHTIREEVPHVEYERQGQSVASA